MAEAIVDTSSILFGFRYRKDVFEALERQLPSFRPAISKGILRELEGISSNRGKKGAMARAALLALKSKKVDVHNINTGVDAWIARQAAKGRGCIVITNDTELAERLFGRRIVCFKLSKSGQLKRY